MLKILLASMAKLAKQFVQNKLVKTAVGKLFTAVVGVLIADIKKRGTAALTRPFANRKNRRLAVQLALQKGGTYDRAVIAGDRYWVVWVQDKTPSFVYPPLPEDLGPLAERLELQNYQGNRIDPSADSSWRVAWNVWARRVTGVEGRGPSHAPQLEQPETRAPALGRLDGRSGRVRE